MESVEIKSKEPITEGQDCEGNEEELDHSGHSDDFIEVGGVEKVPRMVQTKYICSRLSIVIAE